MKRPPGDLLKNLAKNVKKLRGDSTQIEFARRIGIAQSTLNRLEQAHQNITLATVELIANKLRVSAVKLLE